MVKDLHCIVFCSKAGVRTKLGTHLPKCNITYIFHAGTPVTVCKIDKLQFTIIMKLTISLSSKDMNYFWFGRETETKRGKYMIAIMSKALGID